MRGVVLHRLITTALDLVGLLLVVAALSLLAATISIPLALGVAGAGTLAVSWLIDRLQGGKR